MTNDPDEPVIDIHEEHHAWQNACPKCGASPDTECTSVVSGCCIDGIHSERDTRKRVLIIGEGDLGTDIAQLLTERGMGAVVVVGDLEVREVDIAQRLIDRGIGPLVIRSVDRDAACDILDVIPEEITPHRRVTKAEWRREMKRKR